MPDVSKIKGIPRIIDANINRAKEGLRVCEEITRFIIESKKFTTEIKKVRHKIGLLVKRLPHLSYLIKERESSGDVGRQIYAHELKRKNYADIFFANIQRVKESLRVLEEFSKLTSIDLAKGFKKIRYDVYTLEKKITQRLLSVCHRR